jgi:hypothetical protein
MADQGAIGGPNGRPADVETAVKFPLLWQNTGIGPYVAFPNGKPAGVETAIKFSLLWQNSGIGPYVAFPNGMPAAAYYSAPWDQWLTPTLQAEVLYNRNGYITGIITNQTIIVPNAEVFLLAEDSVLLARTFADAAGVYRFDGLYKGYSNYTVLAIDPTGVFNLGRLDNMTPF